nr:MAG TPA: hypothetical protein [Caudoviricetes sp.]
MKKLLLIIGSVFIVKKIIDRTNERKSIKIDSNLVGATIYSTLQEGFR